MGKNKDELLAEARELGLDVSDDNTKDEIAGAIEAAQANEGAEGGSAVSDGVASREANASLEHSQGGVTTRDDLHDQGVPMLQGDPEEPVGPEDALGRGEKRGDYRDRVPGEPHQAVALPGGGGRVTRWVDAETGAEASEGAKGAIEVVVDNKPTSEIVPQRPRTEEIGNSDPQLKGGVTTDPSVPAATAAVAR